jgi:carnitine-CoA ligase
MSERIIAAMQPTPWINPEATTVAAMLRDAARQWPDKTFLDLSGEIFTFRDVDLLSSRLANGLIALGVQPGDRICTLLRTSIAPILFWFASSKIGAVIVPINTAFLGEFLRHQVTDCGARIIVAESDLADRLAIFENGGSSIDTIVHRGEAPAITTRHRLLDLASLASDDATDPMVPVRPGDLGSLMYTSGTTGASKGCMLSQNAPCHAGVPTILNQGIGHDDVLWIALPLFHLAACATMMGVLRVGASLAIAARFSVSAFWDDIERSGATAVFALATMFPLLVDAPETPAEKRCHGRLRIVFGVPFLDGMQQRWRDRFGVERTAAAGYGMTEVSPVASYPGHPVPSGATGKPIACLDVRIVDDEGIEVPPGTPGEIVLRPRIPHVIFNGYWNRPDATAEAFRDLWFHCGDMGKIDADGYLYFVDRKKDYLRKGGENISSHELEMTFRNHPAIEDAAVHAVLSDLSEDEVKVTIILRAGMAVSEEEICRWSMDHLPYFAVPRYIEYRPMLPRNAVGRVMKYELRAEGVTTATWDRVAAGVAVRR